MNNLDNINIHNNVMELLEKYRIELLERNAACKTSDELKQLRIQILGRNGELTELLKIHSQSYKKDKND